MISEESGGTSEGTGELVDRGLRRSWGLRYLLGNLRSLRSLLREGRDLLSYGRSLRNLGLLGLRLLRKLLWNLLGNLLGNLGLNRSLTNLRSLQWNLQRTLRLRALVEVRRRFVKR